MVRTRLISKSKKGVMGIETLIIFIAMILVAAVAAGVLLRTAGLLQQRALVVGSEATQRVVTAFEVISVTANANTTSNTFNEMEVLIRLQAGSYDMSLLSTSIIFNSERFSQDANIQHSLGADAKKVDIPFMDNETWVNIGKIDTDPETRADDYARLIYNISPGIDGLQVNLSSYGPITVSLGQSVQEGSGVIDIDHVPITDFQGGNNAPIFGFFSYFKDNASLDSFINTSDGGEAYISNYLPENQCFWDLLITNTKFCIDTKIGNDDFVLESGEVMVIRYKLSEEFTIGSDENFDIRFVPKYGTIVELNIYVPEVLQRRVLNLWP